MVLENCIHQIPFPQHTPPPVINERDNERQQAQAVVWRQDRQAEQISETNQHEEVLQAAALPGQGAHLVVDCQAIENFSKGAGESHRAK
jgi:hypothetical protein